MIKYKKIIYGSIVALSFLLVFLIDLIQDKASSEPSLNIANQSFSSNKVDVNLVTPDNWQKIEPKSSMRDSEYVIRNSKGEFNLIVFKNIGGSVDQNINRWINQFSGDQNEKMPLISKEIERNGIKFTFLQNSGSFNGGMGQSEQFDNAALIGFIVQNSQNTYYYKAVAEVDVLHESKEDIIDTILKSSISNKLFLIA